MTQRYPRSGELITRLTRSLTAIKGWDKKYTMDYVGEQTGYSSDMVYRWQQGRTCPHPETIVILAKLGKEVANLDRIWGESLLNAAHHPDSIDIVNKLWGPKEIRFIDWNLPPTEHTELIGRHAEITRLLELLSPNHASHLISVDGIGGVGKTALVLEVSYRCKKTSTGEVPDLKVPTFDAIIFVSAKQQYLTPGGILSRYETQRTLQDIFRQVAHTLNRFEIAHATSQEQPVRVREALAHQRTLLIVDNLETMEDKQEIISFLYDLPPSVKVVITTRERAIFSPIRLQQLTEDAALALIEKEAQERSVEVSKEQALMLYQRIGGIPAALVYAVGWIASGYSTEHVFNKVLKEGGDVAHFCFEGSIETLRGQAAHYLLMATAIFPEPPLRAALAQTSGLATDPFAVEEGLGQLQQLSLICQQERRYRMLPLTREYALAELAKHTEFEREVRNRWIEWYKQFVAQETANYHHLQIELGNLISVIDWLIEQQRMEEVNWCFKYTRLFLYAKGHWEFLRHLAEHVAVQARAIHDPILLGESLESLINICREQEDFEDARKWLDFVQNTANILGDELLYAKVCLSHMWMLYRRDDCPEEMVYSVIHAIDIFRRYGRADQVVKALNTIGNRYLRQHRFEEARNIFEEGLQTLAASERLLSEPCQWRAVLQGNLAIIDGRQGRYAEACKVLYEILKNLNEQTDLAEVYAILAFYEFQLGNSEQAQCLRREADRIIEQLRFKHPICPEDEIWRQLQLD